jgi:small GTP-binding protein
MKKKIVLLGDSAVGKTSLIRRYVFDQFEDSYIATIGTKVTMKKLQLQRKNKTIKMTLMIWDLIGREGYQGLHARTFVGTHGAILVTDLTRKETLKSLENYWIPLLVKVASNIPIIFVCNKSDLADQHEYRPRDLKKVAKRYYGDLNGLLPKKLKIYYPTSAKTGKNVITAFNSLGLLILKSNQLVDPVKKMYESLTALGISRTVDTTSPVGALDAIILDFSENFEDPRLAMLILRQELTRAAFDINNPTKPGILRAVEYLAEAEAEYMDEDIVKANLKRRLEFANYINE